MGQPSRGCLLLTKMFDLICPLGQRVLICRFWDTCNRGRYCQEYHPARFRSQKNAIWKFFRDLYQNFWPISTPPRIIGNTLSDLTSFLRNQSNLYFFRYGHKSVIIDFLWLIWYSVKTVLFSASNSIITI